MHPGHGSECLGIGNKVYPPFHHHRTARGQMQPDHVTAAQIGSAAGTDVPELMSSTVRPRRAPV
jgi:hypothetical protein